MLVEYFTGFENAGPAGSVEEDGLPGEGEVKSIEISNGLMVWQPRAGAHSEYSMFSAVYYAGHSYMVLARPDEQGRLTEPFVAHHPVGTELVVSFYFQQAEAAPGPGDPDGDEIVSIGDPEEAAHVALLLLQNAKLDLLDAAGIRYSLGINELAQGVWYRIDLVIYKGATQAENVVKVYLDDVLDMEMSNFNLGAFDQRYVVLGIARKRVEILSMRFYDDVAIGSGPRINGDFYVVYMQPNADGTYTMGWSASPPGDLYEVLDERPYSGADYVYTPGVTDAPFSVNVEPPVGEVRVAMPVVRGLGTGGFLVTQGYGGGQGSGITGLVHGVRTHGIFRGEGTTMRLLLRGAGQDDFSDGYTFPLFLNPPKGLTKLYRLNPFISPLRDWVPGDLHDLEAGAVSPPYGSIYGLHTGIHVLFGGQESEEGHEDIHKWTFGG